jgi:hypothetical protein
MFFQLFKERVGRGGHLQLALGGRHPSPDSGIDCIALVWEGWKGSAEEHMVMEGHRLDRTHQLEGGLIGMVGARVCVIIHLIIFNQR